MAEFRTDRKALHKDVSSIFAGMGITKEAGVQQQPGAPGSIEDDYVVPKPSTAARKTRSQPGLARRDRGQQKIVGHKQPEFAAIIKGFKRVIRRIFPSKSRREEKRLRSNWDNWRC